MTEPVREEVVSELVAAMQDALAEARRAELEVNRAAQRRIDDLVTLYSPTPVELDVFHDRLVHVPAPEPPVRDPSSAGWSVFDAPRGFFSVIATVYHLIDKAWRTWPDRRLGDLLKTSVPTELAQEVVGYLVWAGLCDPPGDGAVAISAPPPEEDP